MKIFLGGTCSGKEWRNYLIPSLEKEGIDYFNPVAQQWDESKRLIEEIEKNNCTHKLYYINSGIQGVYSIAEAAVMAVNNPHRLIFWVNEDNLLPKMGNSLLATCGLFIEQGCEFIGSGSMNEMNGLILKVKEVFKDEV